MEAARVLERVVSRLPTVEGLLLLSEALGRLGRTAEAARRFEEADRLAEDDPGPMALYLARHDRDPARALALVRRALEGRRHVAAHDAYALALVRAGRPTEARAAMARALALGTPDAKLHVHAALISLASGDRRGARASLRRARAIDDGAEPRLTREIEAALATEPRPDERG